MSTTATPADPFLDEAISLMHDINRRLLAGRLSAARLTWRASGTRVDCRVLDGEACVALVPTDAVARARPVATCC